MALLSQQNHYFVREISKMETPNKAWENFNVFCEGWSVYNWAYYSLPLFEDPINANSVASERYRDGVYDRSRKAFLQSLSNSDVRLIKDVLRRLLKPILLNEFLKTLELSTNYFEVLTNVFGEVEPGNILLVPTFGPRGCNACFIVNFGKVDNEVNPNVLIDFSTICQKMHTNVVCESFLNANIVKLSSREIDILNGVARGLSNKDIASELSISSNTVSSYLRAIFIKTKSRDRTSAVLRGIVSGLIR